MTDARAWGLLTASGMAAIATTLVTLLRAGELDDLAAALDATRDR
jgi:cystathionine beta-lyase/cystathionine gamma-synthase